MRTKRKKFLIETVDGLELELIDNWRANDFENSGEPGSGDELLMPGIAYFLAVDLAGDLHLVVPCGMYVGAMVWELAFSDGKA